MGEEERKRQEANFAQRGSKRNIAKEALKEYNKLEAAKARLKVAEDAINGTWFGGTREQENELAAAKESLAALEKQSWRKQCDQGHMLEHINAYCGGSCDVCGSRVIKSDPIGE